MNSVILHSNKQLRSLFEEPCKLGVVVESPAAARTQESVPNFGVIAAKTSDVRAVGFSEIYVSGCGSLWCLISIAADKLVGGGGK